MQQISPRFVIDSLEAEKSFLRLKTGMWHHATKIYMQFSISLETIQRTVHKNQKATLETNGRVVV